MSDHTSDESGAEPFERLESADPARGSVPDLNRINMLVRNRMSSDAAAAPRPSWHRSPRLLQGVAASVAALVIGAGGFALGAETQGGVQMAAPGMTSGVTEESTRSIAPPAGPGGPAGATGLGAVNESPLSGAADMAWQGPSRTLFTEQGLSDAPGAASAWGYDAKSVFNEESVERLAAALGLAGDPELRDGAWLVGSSDGSTPTLTLHPDGLASVNYYNPQLNSYSCEAPVESLEEEAGIAPGELFPDKSAPECKTGRPADISTQEAEQRLRQVMTEAGVDVEEYEFAAPDYATNTFVEAHRLVDGERTGPSWSMGFAGTEVQHLYGSLAPLTDLGEYPVVSEKEAVRRLMDPRFGDGGGYPSGPVTAAEAGKVSSSAPSDLTVTSPAAPPQTLTVPGPLTKGDVFSWPVSNVTIVKARLTLALQTQPTGASALLPTYELSAEDGSVWSVVAVTDDRLDFSK